MQCAENQHAHFSSALGLFREKEARYHIHIVLELIPFMPQCPKHLTETAEEKKDFIWPQFQRITLCHNRRGVGRKTLSVREDGELGGRELGDKGGRSIQVLAFVTCFHHLGSPS